MRTHLLLALLFGLTCGTQSKAGPCSGIDPDPSQKPASQALRAEDLIQLRDIGWNNASDAPLSLSPDGRHLAFSLRRADVASNSYCLAIIILDLRGNHPWTRLDTGGDVLLNKLIWDGRLVELPNGVPQAAVPRWSPDSRQILFLRRDEGVTQAWRADIRSGKTEQVTHSVADIEDVAWDASGRAVIFASHPGMIKAEAALEQEARTGFHYDERFFPFEARRPLPADRLEPVVQRLDFATHVVADASPADRARLQGATAPAALPDQEAPSPDGKQVEIEPADPERIFLADEIHIYDRNHIALPCRGEACRGRFTGHWWGPNGALYFLKHDGWAGNRTSLFRWTASDPEPRRLLSSEDLITGCVEAKGQLLCADEGSTTPRRIVSISLRDGQVRTLYQPNPEFAQLHLQPSCRIYWKNGFGVETFGDLVLPPDIAPGVKPPLVIVQYESRGFLRGGTGDEVPIQLFAQAGFAVLSLQEPRDYGEFLPAKTAIEMIHNGYTDFLMRRSVQSSLETGIAMLADRGLIDPKRVGLTGLSDGASTVQFALINSHIFAAVSMAQCCDDETTQAIGGPSIGSHFSQFGVPRPGDKADAYWDRKSIARAADRMDTPMLVQMSDGEYLESLQPWLVLHARGKPIDMFVFPGERHIKLQPAHRYAVYQRNLAWFCFWLQDRVIPTLPDADLDRWKGWQARLRRTVSTTNSAPANAVPTLQLQPARGSGDSDRHG